MSPNKKGKGRKIVERRPKLASVPGLPFAAMAIGLLSAGLISAAFPIAHAQDTTAPVGSIRFEGYPNAPEFSVVSRKDDLFFYPCDQCHAVLVANPEIRPLENVVHDAEIEHGRGRIWCLSCHDLENRDYLKTLLDEPVDFDDAHLVCGGCHASRHRDWVFGAHGKRVETWQGERRLYDCAHCHDPHKPAIEPRAPAAAPPVRAGLELARGGRHNEEAVEETGEATTQ